MNDWEKKDRKLSCKWLSSTRLPDTLEPPCPRKTNQTAFVITMVITVSGRSSYAWLTGVRARTNKMNQSSLSHQAGTGGPNKAVQPSPLGKWQPRLSGAPSAIQLSHCFPWCTSARRGYSRASGTQSQTLWPSCRSGQHKVFHSEAPAFLQKPVPFSPPKNYPKIPTTCFTHYPNTKKTCN